MGQQHIPLKIDEDGNVLTVGSINDDNYDSCVLCNAKTRYQRSTHIDYRYGYVEGCGQLCESCYKGGTERRQILVPANVVYNTPNDQELGAKVRKLYWDSTN